MRDIDDWMFHFERQVTPGLKAILTKDLGELPPQLATLLETLRDGAASKEKDHQAGESSRR